MREPDQELAVAGRMGPRPHEARLDPHLWEGVSRLVRRAPGMRELRAHSLELLAAREWRAQGRELPADVVAAERMAAAAALLVPLVLERVRAAWNGPLILFKGPEVAAWYPRPALRPFNDLDLLAPDAPAAHRALISAGFQPIQDDRSYAGLHHLRPLYLPGIPLFIEVHSRPKWVDRLRPPPIDELFAASVDAAVPVPGIQAPCAAHHAVLLAVHAWAHAPLGILRQLIDVAAVRQAVDDSALEPVARSWGVSGVWEVTAETTDALLYGGPAPWQLRLWARSLPRVRDRTVLENHLERWLAGFSCYGPRRGTLLAFAAVRDDLRPVDGESWSSKLRRSGLAVKNALVQRSRHDAEIESLNAPDGTVRERIEKR